MRKNIIERGEKQEQGMEQGFRNKEVRQRFRDKELGLEQGMKFIGNRKEEKKSLNPKSLNLNPVLTLFLTLILFLTSLILEPLTLNPVLAAPSTGYEKSELETIFEGKDPQGRMYSEYPKSKLNRENDYHTNILYGTVYNKQKNLPMKEEYLPVASFKVEVYRNGKWELVGNTSSDTVKHLGTFKVGDKLRITDTSKANKGTLDTAHFNGIIRIPGYKFNEPNGFGGDLKPGGSKIVELKTRGNNIIALQTSIKEIAYNTKDKIEYPIWSTNGAKHTWGKGMFGKDKNVPWEGWSHFTAVTFDVEKEGQSNIIMRELELIDPETGKVLESFKRDIDNLDPMNVNKQKLIRTNTNPYNASELKKDKVYKVRAKYQFVSFKEGEFDISKPEKMTNKQRNITTKVNPSKLDVKYAFDNNATKEGTFDITEVKTYNKELKNLETATFEWNFKVPETTKKYIKIAGMVPDEFAKKGADEIEKDNWSAVFAKLASNDIGMNKNVRLINEENKVVTSYKKGEYFRLIFPVEHVEGKEIVGTNETKNPKVYINIEVKDENGKVIFTQSKLQARTELHPKTVIDMPISEKFRTNSNKITVCATIDPIHKTLGYNDDPRNDKICVTYEAGGVDIGMAAVELYRGGQKVKFFEPNKSHTVQFSVRHFLGDEAVGLDPTKNPKVRINIKVMDARNRLLLEQTVQTNQVLNPGATIKMPMSSSFSSETGMIRACATIDPIHAQLGYNSNPENDTICADFMMVKNYAIRDLRAYPQSIHFGKNESQLRRSVTLNFTVINESSDEHGGSLPSSPVVEIRHGGQVVWRNSVSISPGQSRKMSVTIPDRVLRPGDNVFTVEVNPDRTILEFKPGVSDPYADNKATTSIRGVEYAKCQECMTSRIRKRNDWRERWEWYEQRGVVRSSTYRRCFREEKRTGSYCAKRDRETGRCIREKSYTYWVCVDERDVPYEYCQVTYRKEWDEIRDYYETFEIADVLFRSKYTKDNRLGNDGWVSVKNGGQGRIKAGYGFELQIKTRYRTNRNIAPLPNPYTGNRYRGDAYGRYPSGYCDIITRYPGVTPVYQKRHIYMEMPYVNRSGDRVCYILSSTKTEGPWYNETVTFELPLRSSFGVKNERKIYINEGAKPNIDNPGKYEINIVTPRPDMPDKFYGYYPENQVGNGKKPPSELTSYLHDCDHFYLVIMPQDDIKTHIVQ